MASVKTVVPVALLVSLLACEALGPAAPLPERAVAFVAPPEFQAWWARTEACSGQRGKLEDVAWFIVPGASTFKTTRGAMVGRWSRGGIGTQIVVAGSYITDELVVRHEMLHALLDREGHPLDYFAARCHLTWRSWAG